MLKSCVLVMAAVMLTACGASNPREPAPHEVAPPVAGAGTGAGAGVGAGPGANSGTGAGVTTGAGKGTDANAAGRAAAGADTGPGAYAPPAPAGPGVYAIDPSQSEIRLLVYRAGAMARLGHNHVITHRAVGGWIRFTGNPTAASFALTLPVADFVVDSPGARAQEGTEFFEEVTEDAKEGTRHNMLSEALLDGDHFPAITLVSALLTQEVGGMIATMTLRIAGHESTLVVPFQVATAAGQISASGIVKLRQTALGLKPFSILLGALQVQDEITVKFTLFAATRNTQTGS